MTKNDVKQYLEKIYKVDVLDVTTIIKQGQRSSEMVIKTEAFLQAKKIVIQPRQRSSILILIGNSPTSFW